MTSVYPQTTDMTEHAIDQAIGHAATQWKNEGWVVVDGLVPADATAAALTEIKPPDFEHEPAGTLRRPDIDARAKFRYEQFDGTTLFPYPDAPNLNRLFVHPNILAFAEAALETSDLRIYQSRVWSKYGDHANYEQSHHIDANHSLLPVRQGAGWGHIEFFLYLHDTDDSNGAPRVSPRSASGANGLGIGEGLGGAGTGAIVRRDEAPQFYDGEVSATGKAGSLFAYRSDVWHRGVAIPPGKERHILTFGYRAGKAPWINFDSHAPLVTRPDFVSFVEQCTPRELALFNFPLPGHEFWTQEVLDATARIYPGLDLDPWRTLL